LSGIWNGWIFDGGDGMFGGLWRIGVILAECSVRRSDAGTLVVYVIGTSMVYVTGTFDGELRIVRIVRIVRRWK